MTSSFTSCSPRLGAGCASFALAILLSSSALLSSAAGAQVVFGPLVGGGRPVVPGTGLPMVQGTGAPRSGPTDPADTLSMHLRTLSVAPRSLSALLGAGESALAIGDPNAAVGFFARAEEVDGRSGKAKAGLASALVMMERADDALPLFAQAVSLGVPESWIASDRGLAYDLRGDSRRAQRDYALALKRAPDDETTRRYALSLGISGDRAQAMTLLDPLLRKQDQGAWRARAFILAMTGDVAGANGVARQVMPANLASTMSPFLTRLPQLNAADKAHAVAFGTMPSSGTSLARVQIEQPSYAARSGVGSGNPSNGLIPMGTPFGARQEIVQNVRAAVPLPRDTRSTPGREVLAMTVPPRAIPAPGSSVSGRTVQGTETATVTGTVPATVSTGIYAAGVAPVTVAPVTVASPSPVPSAPPTSVQSAVPTAVQPVPAPIDDATPAFETAPVARPSTVFGPSVAATGMTVTSAPRSVVVVPRAQVAVAPRAQIVVAPRVQTPGAVVARPMSRLASILAGLTPEMEAPAAALPTAAETRAARRLAQRKAAEAAAVAADLKAEKAAKAAIAAEARRNPARLWVQVATGSNVAGLPTTWSRIRSDNEKALTGKSGWSASYGSRNRVLVGPMKSPAEARALVNTLAKDGLSANTYSSEVGEEVVRIGGK